MTHQENRVRIFGEAERREMEIALEECGSKHSLPALSQTKFLCREQPRGCSLASVQRMHIASGQGKVYVENLPLVMFREKDGERITLYRYPKATEDLLSGKDNLGFLFKVLLIQEKSGRKSGNPARVAETKPSRQAPTPAKENPGERPTQVGTRFVLLGEKIGSRAGGTVEEKLGLFLDEVKARVIEYLEDRIGILDKILNADPGSEAEALLTEKAVKLEQEFEGFLNGENFMALDFTASQKLLAARVAAMHYAGELWNASGISPKEKERALWFLLKTGALRITTSKPRGSKGVKIGAERWLEFSHVLFGAPTSDSRAGEASRLLHEETLRALSEHFAASSEEALEKRELNRKEETISSLVEILKSPREGKFSVWVPPFYNAKRNVCIGGASLLVAVKGNEHVGFRLRVVDIQDSSLLFRLEGAASEKKAGFSTKVVSLSEDLTPSHRDGRRYEAGAVELPLTLFEEGKLQSSDVDREELPRAVGEERELRLLAFRLTRILRSSFIAELLAVRRKTEKSTVKEPEVMPTSQVLTPKAEKQEPAQGAGDEAEKQTEAGTEDTAAPGNKPEATFPAPLAGTLGPAEEQQKPKQREKEPKAKPVNEWASPQAKTLAEKLGIADEVIPPKRTGGKVTKGDVESFLSNRG